MAKQCNAMVGEKQHFHVKGGETISVVPETLNTQSNSTTKIDAQLTHDGLDAYHLLYLGIDDCYSLTAVSSEMKSIDSICVVVLGCQSKQHEILVKEGDMFAIVVAPGHSYHIKYENDSSTVDDSQNLTLYPENDITLNPAPGRSYLVYALPVEHRSKVKATIMRVRAMQQ